ncbi:MAG: class I SAM-dependent methyltransferase [Chloroflexi bacterium]|nr:class I SAM-dependent methyltransferase [Chloroflexota bacterium]
MINRNLLIDFLRVYAFQPATALWRAVEVDVFRRHIPDSGTCLDLGCGDGKLTSILFAQTPLGQLNFIGIDADEDETRQAGVNNFYSRVHTCLASQIPEASESIDHIISNSVLEHIPDIEPVIAEAARLLKPGGTFTFSVPSTGFHECLHGPLLPGASREAYLRQMDKRLAHFYYFDSQGWKELLERNGLEIASQVGYFNRAEVHRWETISRFTAGILYLLSGQKLAPIQVQKKLGLRKAQNTTRLPAWLASLMASILLLGLNTKDNQDKSGCLLVHAYKKAVH